MENNDSCININVCNFYGKIISDINKYVRNNEISCEFDIELINFDSDRKESKCSVTCVSNGAQAELIIHRKKRGDNIMITGYLGEVGNIGIKPTKYGHHKIRITNVHINRLNFVIIGGKLITEIFETDNHVEFYIETKRKHVNNKQTHKTRIICTGVLGKILMTASGKKKINDYLCIYGYLNFDRGEHTIYAQHIDLMLKNKNDNNKDEINAR